MIIKHVDISKVKIFYFSLLAKANTWLRYFFHKDRTNRQINKQHNNIPFTATSFKQITTKNSRLLGSIFVGTSYDVYCFLHLGFFSIYTKAEMQKWSKKSSLNRETFKGWGRRKVNPQFGRETFKGG